MPKISAPSVAAHRAQRRLALLHAAVDLLVEGGVAAVTPAAVGARAGLARSSVYEYFSSTAELLAAVVEESFPPADAAVATAVAAVTDPLAQIEAYVRETLRQAASGVHRPAAALAGADLPPACRDRLAELHAAQAAPLRAAVRRLGVPEPQLTADLIGGLVQAAMRQLDGGAPLGLVTGRTLALLRHGLAGRG